MRHYRLMAPGPVPLSPEVRQSMAEPMIHHRTPEFSNLLKESWDGLKALFGTDQQVLMQTATGSGGMEAALVNTLSPGDSVLIVDSGKFGERWYKMALAYGLDVHRLQIEWGKAVTVEQIAAESEKIPHLKALFCQACETSTGVLHPIKEIGALVAGWPETLFIVDAITVLGAAPLEMDNWGVDVVVGGAQKGLMLPPGLALVALSKKAWRFNEVAKCPRFYFDLRAELLANNKGETRFSSAVSHIRALPIALNHLLKDGLQARFDYVQRLAQATRKAGQMLGLEQFPQRPSPTLTTFRLPTGLDGAGLRRHLEEKYLITVMGGQDHLKGKIIRVGHLGYILPEDIYDLIGALGKSLQDFGQPITGIQIEQAQQQVRSDLGI